MWNSTHRLIKTVHEICTKLVWILTCLGFFILIFVKFLIYIQKRFRFHFFKSLGTLATIDCKSDSTVYYSHKFSYFAICAKMFFSQTAHLENVCTFFIFISKQNLCQTFSTYDFEGELIIVQQWVFFLKLFVQKLFPINGQHLFMFIRNSIFCSFSETLQIRMLAILSRTPLSIVVEKNHKKELFLKNTDFRFYFRLWTLLSHSGSDWLSQEGIVQMAWLWH